MPVSHPIVIVLLAIVVWWFSTGLVLAMVHRSEKAGWQPRHIMPLMTLAGVIGFLFMVFGSREQTPLGSYAGFFGALLVWAWHEVAFLTGALTGRRTGECPADLKGFARFHAAWEAVCDHEIAILLTGIILALALAGSPNPFGLAAFGLLWGMRISVKFLIFLGAPHAVSDLMPSRIAHLKSYFNTSRLTPLFPVLLSGATVLLVFLIVGAGRATQDHSLVGHILLATFMALAIIEHVVLVVPVSDLPLWRWALPKDGRPNGPKTKDTESKIRTPGALHRRGPAADQT